MVVSPFYNPTREELKQERLEKKKSKALKKHKESCAKAKRKRKK